MIDHSLIASPPALWNLTEASFGPTPGTSRSTWYRRKNNWRRRLSFRQKPTSFWRRKRCGYAEASKHAEPAAKAESVVWSICVRAAKHAVRSWAAFAWMWPPGGSNGYQGKIVAELTGVGKAFGDKDHCSQLHGHHSARRQGGADWPQWRRQDHLAQDDPWGSSRLTTGTIRQGANLQVAYFDQMRHAVNLDATLEDFISPGSEWIEIGNQRKHVKSYLSDFPVLSGPRALLRFARLSGGERNRLTARASVRPSRQCAGAGRADQRSGHRHAGSPGRTAGKLRRHRVSWSATTGLSSTTWSPAPSHLKAMDCGASTKAACRTGCCNPNAARPLNVCSAPPPKEVDRRKFEQKCSPQRLSR